MSDLTGETFGQYRILRELGRGGMAVVYEAYQPSLNRTVAIKLLPQQFTFDRSFVQRFQQEARAAAQLEHPHIVPIYDVGEAEGQHYIVMQRLVGEPLNVLIGRARRLPLERAVRIIGQMASALDYAHRRGIVHRDIKPANIIVGSAVPGIVEAGDHAWLTDFGIAKAVASAQLTRTGTVIGTAEYMSPEQALGKSAGPASDIYSLGIVLYQMLTGQLPFQADSTAALLHKQAYEPPPSVRKQVPDLPPAVEVVLGRALAKEPTQRFRTATEFAQALEAAARGKPLPAPARTTRTQPAPAKPWLTWRRLLPLAAAAVILLALLIATLSGIWAPGQPAAHQPPAPTAPPSDQALLAETTGLSSPSPPSPPAGGETTPAKPVARPQVIARQAVNVYTGPGDNYPKAGQTTAGQTLEALAFNEGRTWLRVCCVAGEPTWVRAELVDFVGSAAVVPVEPNIPPTPTISQEVGAALAATATLAPPEPLMQTSSAPSTDTPRPPPPPTPRPAVVVGSPQCPRSSCCITSPVQNETLKGVVPIQGTATDERFDFYKFEYRPESKPEYTYLVHKQTPVVNGILMDWWTMTVPPGTYWLRLTVVDKSGNYKPPAELRIYVAPR